MFRLGICSLGHLGVVRDRKWIVYNDGSKAEAYVGYHLLPLRLFGRRWSSRNPKWVF